MNVLSEDTRLQGIMVGEDVSILGVFEGELKVRGRLEIGPSGRVKGVIRASAVAVNGAFDGEIHAERLSFGPAARATGRFEATRLSVLEGALVDGPMNLPRPAPPAVAASAPTPDVAEARPELAPGPTPSPTGDAPPPTP